MDAERELLATPPADWRADRVIAFDWYDGARQGVCRLVVPSVEFVFRLLDERPTEDDLDDRVFSVELLPRGSVARMAALLAPLGSPLGLVWAPVFRVPDLRTAAEIKTALRAIEAEATPTSVVFYTRDFETFLGRWPASAAAGDGDRPWLRLIDREAKARPATEVTS
jgi:hypothetical protein